MSINIPKRIGFGEGGKGVAQLGRVFNEIKDEFELQRSAIGGDIEFEITPATVDAEIDAQNVGTQMAGTLTVAGTGVTSSGTGDITVTVTAEGMTGSPKAVSVTLANSDAPEDIAGKIKTALETDANVGHATTGYFTATVDGAVVTLTKKAEEANDETFDVAVETDTATLEEDTTFAFAVTVEGVAPYTREVTIRLVNSEGNLHNWFTGTVPVTIAEVTDGDGTASVVGGLSPTMTNGVMTVNVKLIGTWTANDTNTLSVTEATILGYTVTAVTSAETSVDTSE